ncbi:leucine-rich repeat protein 1 isoform X2 [Brienomyrus brachyistius]|uniref:leucine-rich repeat protein 1 isoform X2 n=1 Tax=Brienomyrus brachyistius TaxID=42636 RepID=UPI0020B2E966|nr:leucine-rich repeat protein 1 isoform X2 [Brienomyrus brachyistius]
MKLQCDVEVIHRMLPTYGLKNRGRGTRAVLSIGKHLDKTTRRNNIYLMICTQKDRAGSKYKADANSLKNFLSAARLAHRGSDSDTLPLSTLTPVRARDVERPKKKLAILSKKDYPLTSNFPYSLEQLQVSYCKLSRVDMRMLSLKSLRCLDLSNNHIKKLPETIGDLGCLAELVLHNNHLETFSAALCLSSLQRTLKLLDLSRNRLHALPDQFCQLRELISLKLDNNLLERMPSRIGQLSKLRSLSASHNKLPFLPAGFRQLSLENLDLFGNPFAQPNSLDHTMRLTFPLALQEMASRAVLDLRIPFGPHLIPAHLCKELELAKTCDCGRTVVDAFIQMVVSMNLHLVSHMVVLVDDMGSTEAPVQRYFCSLACYSQFLDICLRRGVR